jgi:cytochrome c-type biogenesis protein CcmH/NrfF
MSAPEATMVSRRRALGYLALLGGVTAGCTAVSRGEELTEAEQVYARLMCNCGCNQILGECNHVGCPNSVPMRAEVDRYLAEGRTPDEVVAMFVEKYGPTIRSAPPGEGWFNVSAWITPFLVLVAGAVVVTLSVRRMLGRDRRQGAAVETSPTAPETLERVESELARFTPED